MSLNRLRRSVIALWLGIFTLAVSGIEQNQLADSVMQVATADAVAPANAAAHPADCPMHDTGGHTHKGHADCALCGSLAALTAFALPVLAFPPLPRELTEASKADFQPASIAGRCPSPYSSRAPPSLI